VAAALVLAAAIGFLVKKFKSRAQKRYEQEAMSISAEPQSQSPNDYSLVCYENISGVAALAANQSDGQNQQSTSASDAEHRSNLYQQLPVQSSTERDSHAYDVIQMRDVELENNHYQQLQCQNSTERDSHTYATVQRN